MGADDHCVAMAARGELASPGGSPGEAFPDGGGPGFEHGEIVAIDLGHDLIVEAEFLHGVVVIEGGERRADADHALRRRENIALGRLRRFLASITSNSTARKLVCWQIDGLVWPLSRMESG